MIIIILIAGRPSAAAVMGVVVPIGCVVAAVVATALILYHVNATDAWLSGSGDGQNTPAEIAERSQRMVPLLYVIWGLCTAIAVVTVILCVVHLRRRPPAPALPTPSAPVVPPSPPVPIVSAEPPFKS